MIDIAFVPLDSHVLEGVVEMYESFDVFVAAQVLGMMAVGAGAARSMAIGAFAGYLTFAYIAVSVDVALYTNILYVTLTLIFVGFAFKLVRFEGMGEA